MRGSVPRALLLFGPTASGKSALLNRLFPAGSAELVSADSMQVYRGMDIGTAKPSAEDLSSLPAHLIDIRDPREQFTAGDFVRLAEEAIRDVFARGRLPAVSGGTAFYLRSLLFGMPPAPPSDAAVREAVARDLASRGEEALHRELAAGDPAAAGRIHPHDHYRLTRALEVLRSTGRPLSAFAPPEEPRRDLDFLVIALERRREDLVRRIEGRVDAMFAAGLHGELCRLEAAGYRAEDPGMRAIGYAEFFTAAQAAGKRVAELGKAELGAVREAIVIDTRRYAKRQMTFFRSLPGVEWRDAEDGEGIAERIARWLKHED